MRYRCPRRRRQTKDDRQTNRQISKINDRETFLIFVLLVFIYDQFGSRLEVAKKWEHRFTHVKTKPIRESKPKLPFTVYQAW